MQSQQPSDGGAEAPSRRRAAGAAAVLALAVLLGGTKASPAAPVAGGFRTNAGNAILIEPHSDSILFEKGADDPIDPASLAKLMTLEYVFHEVKTGHLKLDDQFVISENTWRKGGAPSRGSTMFAPIHSSVSLDNLIRAIIVDSANDACMAIAEKVAGSEQAFGALLTKRAREIGLEHSTFSNSTGYSDPGTHMSVHDIAELSRYIMQTYPDFYRYFEQRDFTWNKIRQQNRNPLLAMGVGADGLKTGESSQSGFGLAGSAMQGDLRLIIVIAGTKSDKERSEDARKLLEWGFHSFEIRTLFAKDQAIAQAKVFGGNHSYVPLVGAGAIRLMVPRGGEEQLSARIDYPGPVPAPISKGQKIGALKIWRGDNLALDVPVMAGQDVVEGSMSQRAIDGATELMISLFRAGISRL